MSTFGIVRTVAERIERQAPNTIAKVRPQVRPGVVGLAVVAVGASLALISGFLGVHSLSFFSVGIVGIGIVVGWTAIIMGWIRLHSGDGQY